MPFLILLKNIQVLRISVALICRLLILVTIYKTTNFINSWDKLPYLLNNEL